MRHLFLILAAAIVVSCFSATSFIVSSISFSSPAEAGARGRGSVRHSGRSNRSVSRPSTRKASRPSSQKKVSRPSTSKKKTRPKKTGVGADRRPGKTGPGANRGPGRAGAGAGARADRHDHHHDRYRDRNDARRDYYRYRTVNHLIRVGAYLATRPRYSTTVVVGGATCYYWGGVYYKPAGSQYVVAYPPVGAVVYSVPQATTVVYVGSTPYYYYGGTYYVTTEAPASAPPPEAEQEPVDPTSTNEDLVESPPMIEGDENYEVIAPPVGATVPYLPEEAKEELTDGKRYYVLDGTYYQPFSSEGEIIYMVVENPKA